MKILKYLRLVLFILLSWNVSVAQILIQPTSPNSPFFSFDQLFKIQVLNSGSLKVEGVIQLLLEDHQSNIVLQINSQPLELQAGENVGHQQINWTENFSFGNSVLSQSFLAGGGIPNSQYVYCYRFVDALTGVALGSYCQENTSIHFQLPELVYPFDNETISIPFPVLSWRPPVPFMGNDINYSFRLVQLEIGQSPLDGIYTNIPLIEKSHLKSVYMPYPPTAIPLEYEKNYAWQVTAFYGDYEIGKTDIWEFALAKDEQEEEEIIVKNESYRFVHRQLDGAAYIFTKDIYFAYDNRSYENELKYMIYPKNNPSSLMESIKSLALTPGVNKIKLPIHKDLKLKDQISYVLKVLNVKGDAFYLEFLYDSKLKKQTVSNK